MATSDITNNANWPRQQFHKALQHLAQHGILPEGVTVTESRLLEPLVAIWKISAMCGVGAEGRVGCSESRFRISIPMLSMRVRVFL